MLDDVSVIRQKDPKNALGVAATAHEQLLFKVQVVGDKASIKKPKHVVVGGMGGSALGADIVKCWLDLDVPFEIVRNYSLPNYVNSQSLVIVSSYSGNTEEAISLLNDAKLRDAQIAVFSSGGKLEKIAIENNYPFIKVPEGLQPRMAVFYGVVSLASLLECYELADGARAELQSQAEWLKSHTESWIADVPTEHNLAKQLAMKALGKTPVIYVGAQLYAVGYKWKISFNENAKNVAFWNQLPEFNHNEYLGWTSHPVDKPFAVFDLLSRFDPPQVQKRFMLSDRLLSGIRPKSTSVQLQGDSVLAQMLWGSVLADFVTIYLALLNGVEPVQVDMIEKFKKELVTDTGEALR